MSPDTIDLISQEASTSEDERTSPDVIKLGFGAALLLLRHFHSADDRRQSGALQDFGHGSRTSRITRRVPRISRQHTLNVCAFAKAGFAGTRQRREPGLPSFEPADASVICSGAWARQ